MPERQGRASSFSEQPWRKLLFIGSRWGIDGRIAGACRQSNRMRAPPRLWHRIDPTCTLRYRRLAPYSVGGEQKPASPSKLWQPAALWRAAPLPAPRTMGDVLSAIISIGFHGLAFAMVLYLISVGLSVTMGMMGFVNLAHGVFAMLGGYVLTTLMSRLGVPFALALVCAFFATALGSIVVERLLYRRLYGGEELDQV